MSDPSQLDDDVLLKRSAGGDSAAFSALYRRRQGQVYRFALQISGRPELAEEAVQEAFLCVIRGDLTYDAQRGSLLPWLYGVARNQVLKRLQRDRRYLPLEEEGPDAEAEASFASPNFDSVLERLTREERLAAVRQAVESLPLHYREVVVLCDLQEMSYEEAAKVLDCAVGTIRSRLHRARSLLLTKLKPPVRCER